MNGSEMKLFFAQHAGGGESAIYGMLAPGLSAAIIVVLIFVVIGIIWLLVSGPDERPSEPYMQTKEEEEEDSHE